MTKFAARRFPGDVQDIVECLDTYPEMSMQLGAPWLVYVCSIEGRPVVDWYLEAKGWSLTGAEREWLEWQKKSWLSIWEVIRVQRGRGLELRDLLTGEERNVHEVSASESAEPHLMMLGRVVDTSSVSLICGMHPAPLRPLQAQRVVDRARKKLRRKTAVTPDRLRDERIAWELLNAWSDEVDARQSPPQLQNTDGDPVLLTEERWGFDPAQRDAVIERIAGIENAEADGAEGEESFTIVREGNAMHKEWDNTIIAAVKIGDSALTASTNSLARADAIRDRVEAACGFLLKAGIRTHTDPTSVISRSPAPAVEPPAATAEEMAAVRKMKERHYAQWLNDPIPALDGKTPREAARTKSGRERLKMLLDDVELTESREAEGARFNVRKLRGWLGMG